MNQINKKNNSLLLQDRFSFSDLLLISIFVIFLTPIYFNGMSINYSYLLLPIFFGIKNGLIMRPDPLILLFFIFCFIVFLFAVISLNEEQFLFRRVTSFIIILSLISFVLIRLDQNIIRNFAYAIVILSAILTIPDFVLFFSYDEVQNFCG